MITKLRDVTTGDSNVMGILKQVRRINYDDIEIVWCEENDEKKIIHKMIFDCHSWKFKILNNGLISVTKKTQDETNNKPNATTTIVFKK